MCQECGKTFSVKGLGTRTAILGRGEIAPVQQPDGVSCGWATTKWVLQYFGALDVSGKKLREELNTDAKQFGGNGFSDDQLPHMTNHDPLYEGEHKEWLKLYIPARSAVVLRKHE